jgi:serine/threonine-protein kinase
VSVEVGQVLGNRYRVERLVGASATGTLYEGSDINTHRPVGIKVLAPATDEHQAGPSREHEARAASRIGNPHILEVLDIVGLLGGERCVVTELLEGETLEARMSRLGTIAQTDLAPVLLQTLDGLAAAHRAGIVHRHLTPASVMILQSPGGQRERVKVVDFGMMRRPHPGAAEAEVPHYLAPEQVLSRREVDARSNVFTAGVIIYRAVTGQLPWSATNAADLALKVSLHDPTPVEELAPGLSPELARIITKAMARAPDARYPSAQEMLEAMAQWARGNFLTEALAVLAAPESAPTLPLPRAASPAAPESAPTLPLPRAASPAAPESAPTLPLPRVASPAAPESVPTLPLHRASPASPPPRRPPAEPASTRPRPVVERNPVIVAPVHRPQKPRSEEVPVDLVVIAETPTSSTRPMGAAQGAGTDGALPAAAGSRRGRKLLLWGAVLLVLLGVGTVLTRFGTGPFAHVSARLGESHAASLGAGPATPAATPDTAKPLAATRSDQALDAGGVAEAAPEPSSTPQPLELLAEQPTVPEPPSAATRAVRDDTPIVPARVAPARRPASRAASRPARETATTASPPARADSPKSSANPYAYR